MDILTYLLHGLAYVGVYILNLLIYETIAILIWLGLALLAFRVASDNVQEVFTSRLAAILFLSLLAICVMLLFGVGYIVPLPVLAEEVM